jgi:hypothetical protein
VNVEDSGCHFLFGELILDPEIAQVLQKQHCQNR